MAPRKLALKLSNIFSPYRCPLSVLAIPLCMCPRISHAVCFEMMPTIEFNIVALESVSVSVTVWGCAKGAEKASCGENGCPKGCFWRFRFGSATLRFSDVLRANFRGGRQETDSPETPFLTTVSLHDAFSAPLARSDCNSNSFGCGFFAYSWKLLAYSGAFLLTVDHFSFVTYN